jgi:hypothetical protein
MEARREIRILDTGIVCVETTDRRGNTTVESYTLREYARVTNRRIKQQIKFNNFVKGLCLFVVLLSVFLMVVFINS